MSCLRCFSKWWLAVALATVLLPDPALAEAGHLSEQRATYRVQAGDVLGTIAQRTGVPLPVLRTVNEIAADKIRPGQVLLLPAFYTVKRGDVLGTIAERHNVKLSELYRHNGLKEGSVLKVGQRLTIAGASRNAIPSTHVTGSRTARTAKSPSPQNKKQSTAAQAKAKAKAEGHRAAEREYHRHKVRRNEALSVIAKRYAVPAKELCQINRLGNGSLIRVGQRLNIPITAQNERLTRPKPWTKYARKSFERGKVTLKTLGGKWSGRLLDKKGKILPGSRKHVRSLLASWETGRGVQIPLHPGLYRLIVKVSDEFGGRPIRVVSGYRQRSYARHSKHRVGRALDFSIPGVPNTAVVDFLLTLPGTGVGYYPNSTHVHMDARGARRYWVDTSGPGQPPRYVHRSHKGKRAPASVAAAWKKRRPAARGTSRRALAYLGPRRR